MNQTVVYRPLLATARGVSLGADAADGSELVLRGLWSPRRSHDDTLSLRDYLTSRPNVCFQFHDMPSLLPNIGSVPSEIVVGSCGATSAAAAAIDLSPSGRRQPQARSPGVVAPQSTDAVCSSPRRQLPPPAALSPPPHHQPACRNTRESLPLSTVPYVESLPAFPKAVAAATALPLYGARSYGGWPACEPPPQPRQQQQPAFRAAPSLTAADEDSWRSALPPSTGGDRGDMAAGRPVWLHSVRRSGSPDGGGGRRTASRCFDSAPAHPFALPSRSPPVGARHVSVAAAARATSQRQPGQQQQLQPLPAALPRTAARPSPADGHLQPWPAGGGLRTFPDFVSDTIANFVHRASPNTPSVSQDARDESWMPSEQQTATATPTTTAAVTRRHLLQSSEAAVATAVAALQRRPCTDSLPPPTQRADSMSPRHPPPPPPPPFTTPPPCSTDTSAQPPPVGCRSLRDLLLGTTPASDGDVRRRDADGVSRKRKAGGSPATCGEHDVDSRVGDKSGDDGPLDLSKKASPPAALRRRLHSPPPHPAVVAEPSGTLPLAGSPVALAKKNLHPVTSRVSECLVRSVQKAARIASALAGIDAHDKASLVCGSWHRLLLWLLAEENFSFVVVPLSPLRGRTESPAGSPGGTPSLPPSPTQPASGSGRPAVPTVGFVQAVMSFIDKCHSLRLDRIELDLLFSITLFHLDGQHACSGSLAERLIHQTRQRLMDELLQHTTVAASVAAATGSGVGVAAGVERYTQLLLSLPSLYAIDVRTFEVLFCERLAGPAADMRLLLMDIVLPLLR